MTTIIGLDLSIAKPAATVYNDGSIYHYLWLNECDDESAEILQESGVFLTIRNDTDNSTLEDKIRAAMRLSDAIARDLSPYNNKDTLICHESFAFGAKGNVALDLAGSKYIVIEGLIRAGFHQFKSFTPTQIKRQGAFKSKTESIEAMIRTNDNSQLIMDMNLNPGKYKKRTNYIKGLDDISDSYWCMACGRDKD